MSVRGVIGERTSMLPMPLLATIPTDAVTTGFSFCPADELVNAGGPRDLESPAAWARTHADDGGGGEVWIAASVAFGVVNMLAEEYGPRWTLAKAVRY